MILGKKQKIFFKIVIIVAGIGLLFTSPAIWWLLLFTALYAYAVIDAAIVATRSQSDEDKMI